MKKQQLKPKFVKEVAIVRAKKDNKKLKKHFGVRKLKTKWNGADIEVQVNNEKDLKKLNTALRAKNAYVINTYIPKRKSK